MLIKIQPQATLCRYPSSGVLKTVTAASGTGRNTGAANSLQRGHVRGK